MEKFNSTVLLKVARPDKSNAALYLNAMFLLMLLAVGFVTPWSIVMAYFLETIIIGILNALKIINGACHIELILNDKNENKEEAITEIYKILRPGEPPTLEIAFQIFQNLFFSSDRYDLSDVGRVKINSKLNEF